MTLINRGGNQIEVDFIGLWNERAWGTVEFVKGLKQAVVAAGLKTQLILGDSASMPPVLTYTNDTEFMDSFAGVGLHYPCTAAGRPDGRGSEQGLNAFRSRVSEVGSQVMPFFP